MIVSHHSIHGPCGQLKPYFTAADGWADVLPCPNATLPTLWYCGYGNSSRCQAGISQKTFNFRDGYFADPRNATLSANSTQTNPTTASNASITITSVSSTSLIVPSITANVNGSSNTSNSGSNPISTYNSFPHHEFCPSLTRIGAGIGAGVGVPLALSLATAFTLLFREKRSRKKEAAEYRNGKLRRSRPRLTQ